MRKSAGAFFVLALVSGAANAAAQDTASDVAALRQELATVRAEIERLRALVEGRELSAPRAAPVAPVAPSETTTQPVPAGDPALELLRAQVTEHAQTKVESGSRFPLRISGTVLSSTFVNSGNPNWLDIPNIGRPPTTAPDDGTFSSTLRQSRIAFDASGPALGDWTTSATLAFDFFGGIPGFQTGQVMGLPRLLYAFARFDSPRATILAGQDDAIIAPRNPTSLAAFSFPALFRSGNLYLRVPQVRAEGRVSAGPALLRAVGGITAPIGGDIAGEAYLFIPPDLPGERSQRPAVQARIVVGWRRPSAKRSRWASPATRAPRSGRERTKRGSSRATSTRGGSGSVLLANCISPNAPALTVPRWASSRARVAAGASCASSRTTGGGSWAGSVRTTWTMRSRRGSRCAGTARGLAA